MDVRLGNPRLERVMLWAVLIMAIEAGVLLAVWRWDERVRAAQLRQRRRMLSQASGDHTVTSPAAPPSLMNAAG